MAVRSAVAPVAGLLVLLVSFGLHGQDRTVALWPDGAPNEPSEVAPEALIPAEAGSERPVPRLSNVTNPRIEVFHPEGGNPSGAAVIVAPGGGYHILAIDHEGRQVVRWLNEMGVTAVLLTYRVPRRDGREKHAAALEDARRTVSLVRYHAPDWGLRSDRIGFLGFSAAGHLALAVGAEAGPKTYASVDEADAMDSRPDFILPVYPAYLVEEGDGGMLPAEIRVDSLTPPTFLVHAHDDPHSAIGSARVYIALREAGVPAELHVYTKGGHGFGMWPSEHPVSSWPRRAEEWMRSMGFLE
jgi:acetyl esterase/lipase